MPSTLQYGVRLVGAIVIVSLVKFRFGTSACFFAMLGLSVGGFLPPVFPLLYRAYTTRLLGYRARHVLHPRLPSHSTTLQGVRRVVAKAGMTSGFVIVPIPVLADNYSYMLVCDRTRRAAVVDPADPDRVLGVASALGVTITDVLTTHKHWDHAGGNDELKAALAAKGTPATFWGSATDNPAATDKKVKDDDRIAIGDISVRVVATPGHTTGHVMFLASHVPEEAPATTRKKSDDVAPVRTLRNISHLHSAEVRDAAVQPAAPAEQRVPQVEGVSALFTGDCIFCGGCGAMFECRAAMDVLYTYDVLHRLCRTGPDTLVYVGHEYSQRLYAELLQQRKATMTDEIKARASEIAAARAKRVCTVPSTLRHESACNPLMTIKRTELERLQASGADSSAVELQLYTSNERRV